MNTKNNSITVWRIVFTYMILFYHFDNKYIISQNFPGNIGWYIAVEFFFIVSGYLLYAKLDSMMQKMHSGWDYFVYRYKKIYPYYLGAFLFSLITYYAAKETATLGDVIKLLSYDFFEVFALHGIGLDAGWSHINNTSWFISIMFISGFIIFHCLVKWKDNFCNFVAPLIIMISFSYLYRNMQGIGAVVEISGFYNHQALMRGLADMCLGIFAARLNGYIRTNCRKTGLIRLIGQLGFLFVIAASLVFGLSTRDFLYAMILTVSVGIGFLPSESKLFRHKFIHYWSGITLSIYLLHDGFRTSVFPMLIGYPESVTMKMVYALIYMVVVTISAVIFDVLMKWFIKKGKALLIRLVS